MSSGVSRVRTGQFVGTGAEFTVSTVGFQPRYVRLLNLSDPGTLEWAEGMDDDAGFKHVDGTQTALSSAGITPTSTGFTLGADTDINVDGESVAWVAFE